MRARKMRSFARTRRRVSRSTARISRKISIRRRARRVAARFPVLSRHLSRARCASSFFHTIASPPPFSTRCACLYKIEKRTRSSSRELHLIPTQVRIRFVHGIRLLFRFSFTHGAMMMIRSRGALLVAFLSDARENVDERGL